MIRNPQVMDDLRELQGRIYAFSDHKAVLAIRQTIRTCISNYQFIFCLINAVNLAALA
jgi:hypothetical protein